MVRIGQVWRTKPGKAEAYRRFHARVPEVVERLFRDLGVANYTVFAWGTLRASGHFTKPRSASSSRKHARRDRQPDRCRSEKRGGGREPSQRMLGDVCFAYLEVENYEEMVERYNRHPEAQLFEKQASEFIEFESDPVTGWPLQLDEIWSLPKASEGNAENRG